MLNPISCSFQTSIMKEGEKIAPHFPDIYRLTIREISFVRAAIRQEDYAVYSRDQMEPLYKPEVLNLTLC